MGSKGVVTPLHFDWHENVLCQLLGEKLLILCIPPAPMGGQGGGGGGGDGGGGGRVGGGGCVGGDGGSGSGSGNGRGGIGCHGGGAGRGEGGGDGFCGTNSACMYPCEGVPNASRVDAETPNLAAFPSFAEVERRACVLRPGDALFIPKGVWHYAHSLSPSLSVSFWFSR